jgi:hypothetical protein
VSELAERGKDGRLRITLRADEALVIETLFRSIAETLASDDLESETRARLFPRAYLDPTEEAAEQVWQSVVHDDLLTGRVAALTAVQTDIAQAESKSGFLTIALDEERETQWLTALNDARVVLGTVLNVSDLGEDDPPADDPRYPMLRTYDWLSELQTEIVDVLLGELPETGIE